MTYVPMYLELRHITTGEELNSWMLEQKLDTIYLNDSFRAIEPSLCSLIEGQIGESLETGFSLENGKVKILLVKSNIKIH